jgi:histidinol dehydrogenase
MRVERIDWNGDEAAALAGRLREAAAPSAHVAEAVTAAIAAVRADGDRALLELGERFDGVRPGRLEHGSPELARARAALDPELAAALELAAANIRQVAEAAGRPEERTVELPQGQRVTLAEIPVGAAAIYAPAGRAPYPSSVLMGVIPARVAGVERVVVASPPGPVGEPDPVVLAAAAIAGADALYAIGGAQGIAALAWGSESVAPVDVIAGPGSPWVQEAKLAASRVVGVDGYAGPSELLVLFDRAAPAEPLALDLCAQAEHGPDSVLVAVAAGGGAGELAERAQRLAAERPSCTDALLVAIEAPDAERALALSEAYAPEHLQIACEGAERLAERVRTAGCVFVGAAGATAFGDYVAGSNHVLPTGGAGRFTGPLGPASFRRRISRVEIPEEPGPLADAVAAIARAEGFPVHGESALARRRGGVEPPSGGAER